MTQPSGTGFAPIRRSATLPSKFISERRRFSETSTTHDRFDPVLFFHPSAKIVKFAPDAPPTPSQLAPSIDFDYPVDTIETLPWRSPAERTVAVGRLRLEIPTGLSPFLKCGNVVQAILKNSQCWCVDGKSTFVLRIRSLTYYRIELPDQTPEDVELIENFKTALANVLRYEVTPCPFQRGFSVPLPAEAHIPKKKRAWRPKHRRESAPAGSESDKTWPDAANEGENVQHDMVDVYDGDTTDDSVSTTTTSVPHLDSTTSEDIPISDTADDTELTLSAPKRSITEPAHSVHDMLARFQPIPESDSEDDSKSFQSLSRQDSNSPPSPSHLSHPASPFDDQLPNLTLAHQRLHNHNGDISEATITAESLSTFQPTPNNDLMEPVSTTQEQAEPNLDLNSISSSSSSPEPDFSDAAATLRTEVDVLSPSYSTPDGRDSTLLELGQTESLENRDLLPLLPASEHKFFDANATLATGADVLSPNSPTADRRDSILRELRRTRSFRKRDLSPLPPASTLEYLAPRPSKSMTTLLFNKACSLVLILPLQLLLFFIHLAAQFVSEDSAQRDASDAPRKSTNESDGDENDFKMPKTPGTFRRSLSLGDPSDALSDLE
ncbi:uncharacterized protein BHQ10_004177 [Talaromyces amestolkiae]|uniref:Inheritance of peroxisomes protein 1 n=1 Tax=Talaromyces amestolkiae TaxID=1196081 RepID=A0A364KX86_TALAM|nr:uncharacterized protein BHQ10_004177 [Talaromyces amestolkiae]RAO68165.1 hypothetical protein BHQ10_004177 [Talaromyces amestolkiae]